MDTAKSIFQKARIMAQLTPEGAAELLEISRSDVDRFDAGTVVASARQLSILSGYRTKFSLQEFPASLTKVQRHNDAVGKSNERARKSLLGQFFTPEPIASFMANLFSSPSGDVKLLDAGAGEGILTSAFVNRWAGLASVPRFEGCAFECDENVLPILRARLAGLQKFEFQIIPGDFLGHAALRIGAKPGSYFSHAILNPPYKKIGASSLHRELARRIGFETVNLYSAFVGAALAMLKQGGELVAIIPRSFCNGPYYLGFRNFILSKAAIAHIHVFASRVDAFAKDEVLQENVILKLVKSTSQGAVIISSSTDHGFSDYSESKFAFSDIVEAGDRHQVIHIPAGTIGASQKHAGISASLNDLGISCSTGPIVDFRMKESLRADWVEGTIPLLYPMHFSGGRLSWPVENARKPNAIEFNEFTRSSIWPCGHYTVVRRLSSKEERRRVFAAACDPDKLFNQSVAFENHLNVFHRLKGPLDRKLAWGLAAYLNSSIVDQSIRAFSGHTQVNASDLRRLRYPSMHALEQLGQWYSEFIDCGQSQLDARLAHVLS